MGSIHAATCEHFVPQVCAFIEEVNMQGILGLIILVLDIVAIVDCLKTIKDTGKKVLWILLILILPVIGLILYYLVGKKQA